MKLTPTQRKTLLWVRDHQPVGMFPVGEVSLRMVRKLDALGLVKRVGKDFGTFGFAQYALTDKGNEALT